MCVRGFGRTKVKQATFECVVGGATRGGGCGGG